MPRSVGELLKEVGAIMGGHFLLSSGRHSPVYLEKFRFLQYPRHTARLCRSIARRFRDAGVQVVAGPTTGGILVAYEVARQLGVESIYAEGSSTQRVFRRGFALEPGTPVLAVDDILTTGGSLLALIDAVERLGGKVVGAAVIIDRAETPVDLGIPFYACYEMRLPTYAPEDCSLCREGLPLVRPGGLT